MQSLDAERQSATRRRITGRVERVPTCPAVVRRTEAEGTSEAPVSVGMEDFPHHAVKRSGTAWRFHRQIGEGLQNIRRSIAFLRSACFVFLLCILYYMYYSPCESGGIGRRAGFRFQYRKVYGFKSRLSYHLFLFAKSLSCGYEHGYGPCNQGSVGGTDAFWDGETSSQSIMPSWASS